MRQRFGEDPPVMDTQIHLFLLLSGVSDDCLPSNQAGKSFFFRHFADFPPEKTGYPKKAVRLDSVESTAM